MKFANKRKAAGVPDQQAEAEAAALGDVDVATKRDLKELELRMMGELTLIQWMLGILLGGVIALILKSFFPGSPHRGGIAYSTKGDAHPCGAYAADPRRRVTTQFIKLVRS